MRCTSYILAMPAFEIFLSKSFCISASFPLSFNSAFFLPFGLPNTTPCALRNANASFVRWLISCRSISTASENANASTFELMLSANSKFSLIEKILTFFSMHKFKKLITFKRLLPNRESSETIKISSAFNLALKAPNFRCQIEIPPDMTSSTNSSITMC